MIGYKENALKGILICILCYFFVSLIGLFEKGISHTISVSVILFFQNIICLSCILIEWVRGGRTTLKTRHFSTHFVRIVSGLGCYAVLFYIIRFMPISEALVFQYSASLWIPFIMLFWLNEKMSMSLWYGILIGFSGILFFLNPSSDIVNLIALCGIICGILQGLSIVAIRKLAMSEPILRVLFYYFAIGTVVTAPLAVMNWSVISGEDYFLLLGVGVSTFVAQMLITISLRYANPTILAPVCYSSILFSGVFSWLFWDEVVGVEQLIGMSLIVLGCILTLKISCPRVSDVIAEKA